MYWSVRSLGKRGSGQFAGQLDITRDTHSHLNPFIYSANAKVRGEFRGKLGNKQNWIDECLEPAIT
jgi:hypothetical protein